MGNNVKYYVVRDGITSQISWTKYYYEYRYSCKEEVKKEGCVYVYM